MGNREKIRIIIVDDYEFVSQSFALWLNNVEDFDIVDTAHNAQDALTLCSTRKPHVVLMDAMMPGIDGIEATRLIKAEYPDIQVIIVTNVEQKEDLVPEALQAGAIGFLLKSASPDEVIQTIRMAHEKKSYLSQEVTQILVDVISRAPDQAKGFNLTKREREVLRLIANNKNNHDIAEELSIVESTVKYHISNILSKLDVSNRHEAAAVARDNKLLD